MKLQVNTFTNKQWGGCKYFRVFSTAVFKQILLQQVIWNKYAHLKEQGYNGFPQINISLNFSRINHRPLVIIRIVATGVVK